MSVNPSILIIGAGCFGVSTAYHLLKRGYKDVTVLDRSPTLPAPDAASTDLNKIVRSSYDDPFYTAFTRKAIQAWKEEPWTDGVYHECGALLIGESVYIERAYQNDVSIGAPVERCQTSEALRSHFPPTANISLEGFAGYIGHDGGWVESGRAVSLLLGEIKRLGARVVADCTVSELVKTDGITRGAVCVDGRTFKADKVVLASGSWTASTFEDQLDLGLEMRCLATGQAVAKIQLAPEEAERYRACPVILDFSSGFYMFPPTDDNVVKLAIHSTGFVRTIELTQKKPVSTPRTVLSDGDDGLRIPKSSAHKLRMHLKLAYPELAEKPFAATRLCWYTDTPDAAWHIGPHPADPSLFFATGGSGHAFKFFPVLGGLVADALEGKLDPALAKKFAVDRVFDHGDLSRPAEKPCELLEEPLCAPEDLEP